MKEKAFNMSFSKLEVMESSESTQRIDSAKDLSASDKKFLKKGE